MRFKLRDEGNGRWTVLAVGRWQGQSYINIVAQRQTYPVAEEIVRMLASPPRARRGR